MNVPASSRFARYLTVILRWLTITVVIFVLTFRVGAYITDHFLPKVYTATAQIQIRPRGETAISAPNQGSFSDSLQGVLETMKSPEFLLPIIYDLGLDKAWAKRVDQSDWDDLPSQDALLPEDALAYMHKILKIELVRGTNIINITVSSDVPIEAARIANAIADRYKTMRDAAAHQSTFEGISQESPVRIISRAETPTGPAKSNQLFAYLVTVVAAGFLSLAAASFVEIIFLFLRASERIDN